MSLFRGRKPGYVRINSAVEEFFLKRCAVWNVNKIEVKLFLNWKDIVGNDIANMARPSRVVFVDGKSGVLYLSVKNSGHAMFLQYAITGIIDRISVYFGFKAISSIKIHQ